MKLEPGSLFAEKYRIEALIGEGGFARVYRASSPARMVALKVLHSALDEDQARREERFRREADILTRLRSPHVVRIIDFGVFDGTPFLASELLPGEDLADLVAREAQPAWFVRRVLEQVLLALDEAHNLGVVHRDVTPRNIRVIPTGQGPLVKLMDFGIARSDDQPATQLTQTGAMVGTPRYMAPEQLIGGRVTPAADVYSLGVVTYEMLYGPAAPGLDDPTRRLSVVPDGRADASLAPMLNRILEPQAASRPPHARAVLQMLVPPQTEEGATSSTARAGAIVAAALVVVCVLLGARIAMRHADMPAQPPPRAAVAPPTAAPDDQPVLADAGPPPPPEPLVDEACTRPPRFEGWQDLAAVDGLTMRSYPTYAPSTLEAGKRAPLIVILTDHRESFEPERATTLRFTGGKHHVGPRQFAEMYGFEQVADDNGAVIVLSQSKEKSVPLKVDRAAIDVAREKFCIDEDRVYVVGVSLAGKRAMALRCEAAVTAVAVLRSRVFALCEPARLVPYVYFTFEDDPQIPLKGGDNCEGFWHMSIDQHEQIWRKQLGCSEEMRPFELYGDAECRTACTPPFVSCTVPGQRIFPLDTSTRCPTRQDVEYDFGQASWKFFSSLELEAGGDDAAVEAD